MQTVRGSGLPFSLGRRSRLRATDADWHGGGPPQHRAARARAEFVDKFHRREPFEKHLRDYRKARARSLSSRSEPAREISYFLAS